jgi:hypothetical protein
MYVCMYVYIHTYMHTYVHTHSLTRHEANAQDTQTDGDSDIHIGWLAVATHPKGKADCRNWESSPYWLACCCCDMSGGLVLAHDGPTELKCMRPGLAK